MSGGVRLERFLVCGHQTRDNRAAVFDECGGQVGSCDRAIVAAPFAWTGCLEQPCGRLRYEAPSRSEASATVVSPGGTQPTRTRSVRIRPDADSWRGRTKETGSGTPLPGARRGPGSDRRVEGTGVRVVGGRVRLSQVFYQGENGRAKVATGALKWQLLTETACLRETKQRSRQVIQTWSCGVRSAISLKPT